MTQDSSKDINALASASLAAAECGAHEQAVVLAQMAARAVHAQSNDPDPDHTGLGLMNYNPQSAVNWFQKLPQFDLKSGPALGSSGSDADRIRQFEMPMYQGGETRSNYLFRLRQWLTSRNSQLDADSQKRILRFMAEVAYGKRQMQGDDERRLQTMVKGGPGQQGSVDQSDPV